MNCVSCPESQGPLLARHSLMIIKQFAYRERILSYKKRKNLFHKTLPVRPPLSSKLLAYIIRYSTHFHVLNTNIVFVLVGDDILPKNSLDTVSTSNVFSLKANPNLP